MVHVQFKELLYAASHENTVTRDEGRTNICLKRSYNHVCHNIICIFTMK